MSASVAVDFHQTTQCYTPEETVCNQCHTNLKFYRVGSSYGRDDNMTANNCYSVVMYVHHKLVEDGEPSSYKEEKNITTISSKNEMLESSVLQ
jgi:hypothetical protein